jgi:hypothetical protein
MLSWLDDHSRYALSVTVHRRVTGPIVTATFQEAAAQHGCPPRCSATTPWCTRPASPAGVAATTTSRPADRPRDRTETLPAQPPHHLRQGRTLPADPATLAARPAPADSLDERQHHVDVFVAVYNLAPNERCAPRQRSPTACCPRPHPEGPAPARTTASATTASTRPAPSRCAERDACTTSGSIRAHAGKTVLMLIDDLDVRSSGFDVLGRGIPLARGSDVPSLAARPDHKSSPVEDAVSPAATRSGLRIALATSQRPTHLPPALETRRGSRGRGRAIQPVPTPRSEPVPRSPPWSSGDRM